MMYFLRKTRKTLLHAAAVLVCLAVALSLCVFASGCGEDGGPVTPAEPAYKNDLQINADGMTEQDGCYTLYLSVGDEYTLSATSTYPLSYSSTAPDVVSVNAEGKITAKDPGNAVVYISAGTQVKSVVVEVKNVTVPLVSVVKDEITLSLSVENANVYRLNPSVTYDGESVECALTYATSAEAVATVDANGVITAVAAGECQIIITASYNGVTATCAVGVTVTR